MYVDKFPIRGKFNGYGGQFLPETLMFALQELEAAYLRLKDDRNFKRELDRVLRNYAGRPTSLYFAEGLSRRVGAKVYLKREDLAHTGAHKINNTVGQALLAKHMGKTRVIAETGAGQHGVPLPRPPPCSDSIARFIWAPRTWGASASMCSE